MNEIPPSAEVLHETLKGHIIPLRIYKESDISPVTFHCMDCDYMAYTPETMRLEHIDPILKAAGWVNYLRLDMAEMCKP